MKIRLLTISSLITLFIACKSNPNGTYILYESNAFNPMAFMSPDGRFDSNASDRLAEKVKGKRFLLDYKEEFIILKSGDSEMIMNRVIKPTDTNYQFTETDVEQKTKFTLSFHPGYIAPDGQASDAELFITSNVKSVDSLGNINYNDRYAQVHCYLKKLNEK